MKEKSMSRKIVQLLLSLALLIAAGVEGALRAQSQPDPATSLLEADVLGKGFDPTKVYDLGEIDTVSTFNGNLTLRIPLGPTYTLDGGFSYQFLLTYNSSIWDYKTVFDDESGIIPDPLVDCDPIAQQAVPMIDSNVGMGWKLTFGELYSPMGWDVDNTYRSPNRTGSYLFIMPDGSRHELVSQIHPAVAAESDVYHAKDTSFLRLRIDQTATPELAYVDVPDGRTFKFLLIDPSAYGGAGRWQLAQIMGRHRTSQNQPINYLDIDVVDSGTDEDWFLTDSAGRQHRLHFSLRKSDRSLHFERILLDAHLWGADSTVGGSRLDFDFHYLLEGDLVKPPGHTATLDAPAVEEQWGSSPIPPVPLLTRIDLPDTDPSTLGIDRARWGFEYYRPTPTGSLLFGVNEGQLGRAELPTGGIIRWGYGSYSFPNEAQECGGGGAVPPLSQCFSKVHYLTSTLGVKQRQVEDPVTGLLDDSWHYVQQIRRETPNCNSEWESRTTVIAPPHAVDGERSAQVSYYSIYIGGNVSPSKPQNEPADGSSWEWADFGLPFTRYDVLDGKTSGEAPLYLSTESYACPPTTDPFSLFPPQTTEVPPGISCRKESATYVRYERDDVPATGCDPVGKCRVHDRVVAKETVDFEYPLAQRILDGTQIPEAETRVRQDFSQWDGLGHFRRQSVRGSFFGRDRSYPLGDTSTWPAKIQHMDYLHATGTVTPSVFGNPGAVPARSQRWLLNLPVLSWTAKDVFYDRNQPATSSIDVRRAEKTQSRSCWDAVSGDLLATRQQSGIRFVNGGADSLAGLSVSESASDFLTAFTYDASGNLVRERFFGGDRRPLTTSGCSVPSGDAEYRRDHTYQNGVRKTTDVVLDGCNEVLLRTLNQTAFNALNQPTASRAPSGLVTSASYDVLGRLVELDPPGETPTDFVYRSFDSPSNPGGPATLEIRRGTQEERHLFFDGFGRVFRERTRLPDNVWNEKETQYYAFGEVRAETTLHAQGDHTGSLSPHVTVFSYDGSGRPLRSVPPDLGSGTQPGFDAQATTVDYQGRRLSVETTAVQAALSDTPVQVSVQKRTTVDPFGQTVTVAEPSAPGSLTALPITDYRYDVQGKLAVVRHPTEAGVTQRRTFVYDGRGLLLREKHPEQTAESLLGDYDSLGTAGSWQLGSEISVTFHQDPLGRTVQVRDALRSGRLIKEHFFDPATGLEAGVQPAAAQLMVARRHNWIPKGLNDERNVIVTETFGYDPLTGRMTDRQTRTTGGEVFDLHVDYDALGRVRTVSYPDCPSDSICSSRAAVPAPTRTATIGYSAGLMRSVLAARPGGPSVGVSQITYHPNLMVQGLDYTNPVDWVQDIASHDLPRPAAIRTTGATGSAGGHTGNLSLTGYRYDTAGNIWSLGNDRFAYDGVQRLTSARLEAPDGGTKQLGYGYDRLGNLSSVTDDGSLQPIAIDAASNRLGVATYDQAGNMLSAVGLDLTYDPAGMVSHLTTTGINRSFLYTASDERLAALDRVRGGEDRWTLRGLDNQVLRGMTVKQSSWSWDRDYVRDGIGPVAAVRVTTAGADEPRYFYRDHLGSPRLIADAGGQVTAYHKYQPFGWELTDPGQDGEVLKFTGHERDVNCPESVCATDRNDDLDYMHARYYSPFFRRFVSADRVLGTVEAPQSWNRFSYVNNNPLGLIDPTGNQEMHPLLEVDAMLRNSAFDLLTDNDLFRGLDVEGLRHIVFRSEGDFHLGRDYLAPGGAGLKFLHEASKLSRSPLGAYVLAFVGGYGIGTAIDNITIEILGQSLGAEWFDQTFGGSGPGDPGAVFNRQLESLDTWLEFYKNRMLQAAAAGNEKRAATAADRWQALMKKKLALQEFAEGLRRGPESSHPNELAPGCTPGEEECE